MDQVGSEIIRNSLGGAHINVIAHRIRRNVIYGRALRLTIQHPSELFEKKGFGASIRDGDERRQRHRGVSLLRVILW